MNYLTAIIAFPLFLLIWGFELWLFLTSKVKKSNLAVTRLCMLVSTLQMISCWFWLLGFVYSKQRDANGEWKTGVGVLSEAMGEDEEMNCPGLVGAEMILAMFQALFSVITVHQTLQLRRLYNRTTNAGFQNDPWIKPLFGAILGCYLYFCFMTAHNRRCQRSGAPKYWQLAKEKYGAAAPAVMDALDLKYGAEDVVADQHYLSVWVPWQHHFYPIFLIFDAVFGLMMNNYVNSLSAAFSSGNGKTNKTVKIFQLFFNYEAKMIIAGCALAVGIFVVQFILKAKALSMIACVFCVLMYVTYALRRVPMMMLYCQFPPFVNKFGMALEGGDGGNASQNERMQISVLGTACTGKTTLFKQLQIILGGGFSVDDRDRACKDTRDHCTKLVAALVNYDAGVYNALQPAHRAAIEDAATNGVNDGNMTAVCAAMNAAAADDAVMALLKKHDADMIGNPSYFAARFSDVYREGYVPSDDDILRVRKKTESLEWLDVVHPQTQQTIRFHDAPGQKDKFDQWRALRKYEVIDATIFVMAISDFNKYVAHAKDNVDNYRAQAFSGAEAAEGGMINALNDSLSVFEMAMKASKGKPIILFFNKVDLLEIKLAAGLEATEHHPKCAGNDKALVVDYFTKVWTDVGLKCGVSKVDVYPTCATDQATMQVVVTQILQQLLAKQLAAMF